MPGKNTENDLWQKDRIIPKRCEKGKKRSFQGSKRAEKEKRILQYNAEIYAQTADYDSEQNKKSCNIMQKFIYEQQTMTVNKTKNPAI